MIYAASSTESAQKKQRKQYPDCFTCKRKCFENARACGRVAKGRKPQTEEMVDDEDDWCRRIDRNLMQERRIREYPLWYV